ncbi:MAG: hypothetical protein FWD27_05700 [Coriobacteriia bacterium]|nr:hypothetical protein [Coriobacteriia bacterium]
MEVFISHRSALQYWRKQQAARDASERPLRRKNLPDAAPCSSMLLESFALGFPLPLDVMVSTQNAKRSSVGIRFHTYAGAMPDGCFVRIGKDFYVASPELCFLQMSCELSFLKLVELGFELCGSYAKHEGVPLKKDFSFTEDFYKRGSGLSSKKLLSLFISRMRGAHGIKNAQRALRFLGDGSASPRETMLAMLLTLPNMLGGYALPAPELNAKITPSLQARKGSSKQFYYCDLYWPDFKLAVEYDSNMYHSGAEHIARDSIRRNALALSGIDVITVTNNQLTSTLELAKVAKRIADKTASRLRHKEYARFSEAHQKLRDTFK